MSRREINQIIDEAGKVLEEITRQPPVQREFRNMVYKQRDDALVGEPSEPQPTTMDAAATEAWNKWLGASLDNYTEKLIVPVVAEVIAEIRKELRDEFETKIAALRTDMNVVTAAQRLETKRLRGEVKKR